METKIEQMNIVIVGHVDHGKSTFIGRLLADTGSLPEGKLDQVKATCKKNAKPFEYAFLLDALKDEQSQGITIDVARCFFKTPKRHYIIIDAPGHIEFLKNMITGAARAEAAVLLIDAAEGVQENSRRHGYMASLLGIKQLIVLVNKMDLVDYSQERFEQIQREYQDFLSQINVQAKAFVPISAFQGEQVTQSSEKMPWFKGPDVLSLIDGFEKETEKSEQSTRFPVQDIYKFTEEGDDRRLIAGTLQTGQLRVGDPVVFYPSEKTSTIKSIEQFNVSPQADQIDAGSAIGVCVDTQIYIRPGELMCRQDEAAPLVGDTFKANLFWLGKKPMLKDKKYKLKCGSARATLYLKEIRNVLDASDLKSVANKQQIDRHDVAECVFQTLKPIAFDRSSDIESTGRFVIVDGYEIAGGGIMTDVLAAESSRLEDVLKRRDYAWETGGISPTKRAQRFGQTPQLLLITGQEGLGKIALAQALENQLFESGKSAYYLGLSNILSGVSRDLSHQVEDRDEHIRRLGELTHLFLDAGLLLISSVTELDDAEASVLKALIAPMPMTLINVGPTCFNKVPVDLQIDEQDSQEKQLAQVLAYLSQQKVLLDYSI
ncbi:MAG: adenylyl-sulfate kinase [Actinobacteria bacterium]|nr:adenylyl-sulfate kinase [Actinomycetota bacterium]